MVDVNEGLKARPPNRRPASQASRSLDPRVAALALILVAAAAVVALWVTAPASALTPAKAALLGLVEGVTEYLPVSSTGHLLVVQRLIGLSDGAGDIYAIAIQFGAILAVLAVFRRHLLGVARGVLGRDRAGRQLLVVLVVAFLPAAIVGLALGDTIKDKLFSPWPIVAAWVIGGLFLILWRPHAGVTTIEALTIRQAALIGAAQVMALWPGTSRSLVTIAAALAVGLSMEAAVEFSFLLGAITLTAATALDLTKDGGTLLDDYGWQAPLLGGIVAFVAALASVWWMIRYLRSRPLTIFGWYRIAAALAAITLIGTGKL